VDVPVGLDVGLLPELDVGLLLAPDDGAPDDGLLPLPEDGAPDDGSGEVPKIVGVTFPGADDGVPLGLLLPDPEDGAVEGVAEGEVEGDELVPQGSFTPNCWKSHWSNCKRNCINCCGKPCLPE